MSEHEILFTRFERLWHWSQALLIISLMVTGFEVNGQVAAFGYADAAFYHRILAWALLALYGLALFWHSVTGQWKQYIPTTEKLGAVIRFYSVDIFNPDAAHPWKVTPLAKHNPMQRLAYLLASAILLPLLVISGLLYIFYGDWAALGLSDTLTLGGVALVHTAAAWAMLVFLIGHIYMGFTGRPATAYVKAMITGIAPDRH